MSWESLTREQGRTFLAEIFKEIKEDGKQPNIHLLFSIYVQGALDAVAEWQKYNQ